MLVAGMEDDMRRISFSTALLEVNPGDMLLDKVCTALDLSFRAQGGWECCFGRRSCCQPCQPCTWCSSAPCKSPHAAD